MSFSLLDITPDKLASARIEEKLVHKVILSLDCRLTYSSICPSGSSAEASIVMITYWVSVLDFTSYPVAHLVSFALLPCL